jgi:hypothetical protein
MRPPNDNAPAWQGRGVRSGNVISLHSHPKHSIRRIALKHRQRARRPDPYPSAPRSACLRLLVDTLLATAESDNVRVRLFLGLRSVDRAIHWCHVHGEGTGWALPDDADPLAMPWPAGVLVKVVHDEGHPQLLNRLVEVSTALRAAGVAYAAFDHQPGWPNLWARDVGGGA